MTMGGKRRAEASRERGGSARHRPAGGGPRPPRGSWIILAILVAGAATASAPAAAAPPRGGPAPGGASAGGAARAGNPSPAAVPDDWVRALSAEELETLTRKAQEMRLAEERQGVIEEIEASALFPDEAKRPAADILRDRPGATRQDNAARILAAFARADVRFGRALALFREAKYKPCADALAANLREEETDYFSAARHYLRAEALAGLSRALAEANKAPEAREALFDAAEAYLLLRDRTPDRISLASLATQKAGQLYEDAGRHLRARDAYAFILWNYDRTLTADEDQALSRKVDAWREIYADPLAYLARRMGEVERRLAAADSGKATREKQEHIVLVLEEYIRTLEEAPPPPPPPLPPSDSDRPPPPTDPTGPTGPRNPVNPLTRSVLPPDPPKRPRPEAAAHGSPRDGDWPNLPPTRRDRIVEIMKRTMSQRYQDLVRDYSAALSNAPR